MRYLDLPGTGRSLTVLVLIVCCCLNANALQSTPADSPNKSIAKTLFAAPVLFHQKIISPQDGEPCTFVPSCSEYARNAVREHGIVGWTMASDRLLRCHGANWDDYPHVERWKIDPIPSPDSMGEGRMWLGGTLSLLPGLGQAAAGRTADGLSAFGTVALSGLGAVHYARRKETVPAAALAGLTAFFYAGNLYGGAAAFGGRNSRPDVDDMHVPLPQPEFFGEVEGGKSPRLAAWLSTFLPGAGQTYAGRTANGLVSAALNGATVYFLTRAAKDERWVDVGYIYLFAGRFYWGGRQNAVRFAREYNARLLEQNMSSRSPDKPPPEF